MKHKNGYGFKVTFQSPTEAKQYKKRINWIITSDKYPVYNKEGSYERGETE